MRHPALTLALTGAVFLAGCTTAPASKDALDSISAVDESNLSDVMLTMSDPEAAIAYFERALREEPDRLDLQRGLAKSQVKAGKAMQGIKAWEKIIARPDSTNDDRVELAEAQIRAGEWKAAEATLNTIPPTHETYLRYRLEAMVADSKKQWKKADSFYETAAGLTNSPAGVYNNWGYSKLTRGDAKGAERLFGEALRYDATLFTAKNNLVLARARQRKYDLPVVDMSQIERANLLYTAGLSAIKQGDTAIGKGLLQDAIDTHPQHFEAAVRALAALDDAPKAAPKAAPQATAAKG